MICVLYVLMTFSQLYERKMTYWWGSGWDKLQIRCDPMAGMQLCLPTCMENRFILILDGVLKNFCGLCPIPRLKVKIRDKNP